MEDSTEITRAKFIQACVGSAACCLLAGCSQEEIASKPKKKDSPPVPVQPPEESPIRFGALAEMPGMNPEVLSAEDDYFILADKQLAIDKASGITAFNLQVPAKHTVTEQDVDLSFYGNSDTMLSVVNEIKYLRSQRGAYRVDEVAVGVYNGAEDLVSSLWQIVRHPIQSGKGIRDGAKAAYDYFWRVWEGEPLPTREDVAAFASAYYEDQLAELAIQNKFELELAQLPETREILGRQVVSLLTGQGLFEVVTLMAAWLKVTKVAKAKKALPSNGKFFKHLSRTAKFQKKLKADQTKVASVFGKVAQKTSKHIDPRAINTLKGNRPENSKLYRILFQLHHAKRYGGTPAKIISEGLESVNAGRKIPEILHSPKLVQKQIQQAYQDAEKWGVFSDPENVKSLARGAAPYIRKGKLAGQQINVDHIVPLTREPRLGKNLGNLRLMPSAENIRRSNLFDESAAKHLDLFKQEFPSFTALKQGAAVDRIHLRGWMRLLKRMV